MTTRSHLALVYVHLAGLPSEPGVLAVAAEHVDELVAVHLVMLT